MLTIQHFNGFQWRFFFKLSPLFVYIMWVIHVIALLVCPQSVSPVVSPLRFPTMPLIRHCSGYSLLDSMDGWIRPEQDWTHIVQLTLVDCFWSCIQLFIVSHTPSPLLPSNADPIPHSCPSGIWIIPYDGWIDCICHGWI
jgi:hypothetical protein